MINCGASHVHLLTLFFFKYLPTWENKFVQLHMLVQMNYKLFVIHIKFDRNKYSILSDKYDRD